MRSRGKRLIVVAALVTAAAALTGLAARSALAESVTVTKTAGAVVNVKALGSTNTTTVVGSSGWVDVPG